MLRDSRQSQIISCPAHPHCHKLSHVQPRRRGPQIRRRPQSVGPRTHQITRTSVVPIPGHTCITALPYPTSTAHSQACLPRPLPRVAKIQRRGAVIDILLSSGGAVCSPLRNVGSMQVNVANSAARQVSAQNALKAHRRHDVEEAFQPPPR
jgi:hypothetical protein